MNRSRIIVAVVLMVMFSQMSRADHVLSLGDLTVTDWTDNADSFSSRLSETTVSTLDVHICEDSFPPGSVNRANIEAAMNAYMDIPGVNIYISYTYLPHKDIDALIQSGVYPVSGVVWVDYVESIPDSTPDDTSTPVASFNKTCSMGPGNCVQNDGGYLRLSKELFDEFPFTIDGCPSSDIEGAAECFDVEKSNSVSKMEFMHEFGHMFGMNHIDGRSDEDWYDFATVTGHAGPNKDINDRVGTTIAAWDMNFLRYFYPDTDLGDLYTYELVADPRVNRYDSLTGVKTEKQAVEFNPKLLRWDSTIGAFVDCKSGVEPVYVFQISDNAPNVVWPFPAPTLVGDLKIETSLIEVPTTNDWVTVATQDDWQTNILIPHMYNQWEWEQTLSLTDTDFGTPSAGPTLPTPRTVRFEVDYGDTVAERNEDNNALELPVCLYPEGDLCKSPCSSEIL